MYPTEQSEKIDLNLVLACMMLETYKIEFTSIQKNIRQHQSKANISSHVADLSVDVYKQMDRVYKDLTRIKSDIDSAINICRKDPSIDSYLAPRPETKTGHRPASSQP